ncbi:hypothetical protein [Brevibacterium sp. CT2-23B]|uniref:hypothetical protein n=1 Tax=Brevibacterium sp. CT2-23B TaxID=2729630 RepID=UPI00155759E1|nr:hypothetical protein [Brevibacterium sp. CT2-23B]
MNLNEIIPAAWRKPTYAVYALIGVALGAIATAYGPEHVPARHAVATNVFLYVGGAFGLTAAANTIVNQRANGDEPIIEPDDDNDIIDPDEIEPDEELDSLEVVKADEQAALDAQLAAEIDKTPPGRGLPASALTRYSLPSSSPTRCVRWTLGPGLTTQCGRGHSSLFEQG